MLACNLQPLHTEIRPRVMAAEKELRHTLYVEHIIYIEYPIRLYYPCTSMYVYMYMQLTSYNIIMFVYPWICVH